MDDSAANDLAAADDFYFEYRSDFRSGGETLAKWAGEFVERVKANAAAAKIPAEAVAALQKRTAEYTASYSGMGASYYYQSYVRDFAYRYLKDLPDEKRALFGMNPRVTRYAWEPSAKEVGGKSV
jgi:hypothetical protein